MSSLHPASLRGHKQQQHGKSAILDANPPDETSGKTPQIVVYHSESAVISPGLVCDLHLTPDILDIGRSRQTNCREISPIRGSSLRVRPIPRGAPRLLRLFFFLPHQINEIAAVASGV